MNVEGKYTMSATENELVSIIVPVYNVEQQLDRCVASLDGQSYADIEIILVDDGSTDGSPAICDAWKKKEPRVKVVHQRNGGLSAARNTGVAQARGAWICFVDSDDYVDREYVLRMVDAQRRSGADLVISNIQTEDAQGVHIDGGYGEDALQKPETLTPLECLSRGITDTVYVVAWNKLYKRALWENVRFPQGKIHEDEFVFHRIAGQCSRIEVIPDRLYHYVRRSGSIMDAGFSLSTLDRVEARLDRLEYYRGNGFGTLIGRTLDYVLLDWYRARALDLDERGTKRRLRELGRRLGRVAVRCRRYITMGQFVKCALYATAPVGILRVRSWERTGEA